MPLYSKYIDKDAKHVIIVRVYGSYTFCTTSGLSCPMPLMLAVFTQKKIVQTLLPILIEFFFFKDLQT